METLFVVFIIKRNLHKIMIIFNFIILFLVIPSHSIAQKYGQISGTVSDLSTGQPIENANVFLSGTTFGDVTDKDGQYIIDNIPPGFYKIVTSFMGYETEYMNIQITEEKEKVVNFKLISKVLEGESVSISAEPPKEWKKNLEIFKKKFLGSGEYSDQCVLQNPEVLDFKYEKFKGNFEASNQVEAFFINHALGYRVSFILLKFYFNTAGTKNFIYSSFTRFEEIKSENEYVHNQWIKNRLLTYKGSIQHFMRALWQGKLNEEGFEIHRIKGKRKLRIDQDTLLVPTKTPDLYVLKPCSELLKITYRNERDEENYKAGLRALEDLGVDDTATRYKLMKQWSNQVTYIEIPKPLSCIISEDLVVILQPPITHGYWSRDIAPKWLPADYKPPALKD